MSVYRRSGSPFWHFDFTIDGCRFRGSTKAKTKAHAREVEAEKRRAKRRAYDLGETPRLTLSEALGRYWIEYGHTLRSAASLEVRAAHLLRIFGERTPLEAIDDAAVIAYITRRQLERDARFKLPNAPTVGPATINRELKLLAFLLRRARERWKAPAGAPDFRDLWLEEPAWRTRWETPEAIATLLKAVAPHDRAPILFELLTGARWGSVAGLDWPDCDFARREITLILGKTRKPGGRKLTVPMIRETEELLLGLGPQESGPVFTYRGRRLRDIRTGFKNGCKRAGIKDFRIHDLRHTTGSWLVQSGVALEIVQKIFGHSSITQTMRYAHHREDARRLALERVFTSHNPPHSRKQRQRKSF